MASRGWQRQTRPTGVNHNCHAIVLRQLFHQQSHRLLDQRQALHRRHRPGNIEQKYQVTGPAFVDRDLAAFQSDPDEAVRRFPGTTGHININRERLVAVRLRIIIREVVDHLLDPDCILWRK